MAVLEDQRLKIFMAAARLGSFTKAAAECRISQPAVSQNISELEKLMGRQLFVRKRGAIELTSHGQLFMEYARQIQYWYGAARRAFGEGLPVQLRPERKSRKVYIGVTPEIECRFVEAGSPDQDVEIVPQGDDLRVSVIKRQQSLDGLAAHNR